MSEIQPSQIVAPQPTDKTLTAFSTNIQRNFTAVFAYLHNHPVNSATPKSTDGNVGDIYVSDDGTNVYLWVKTNRGWFRTSAMTAL